MVIRVRTLAFALSWTVLGAVTACIEHRDSVLFSDGGTGGANLSGSGGVPVGGASGSSGAGGTGGSVAGSSGSAGTGGSTAGSSGAGGTSGGSGGVGGSGGAGGGGSGGVTNEGGGAQGGEAGSDGTGQNFQCTGEGEYSVKDEVTGHCYFLNEELLDFAAARKTCEENGGYLVVIESEEENSLVWSLHADEHWIGTSDGKKNGETGVGTYEWVNGAAFEYTKWSEGQPNAVETDCPGKTGGCYEHCGFQWMDGTWNDRACFHEIPSVCEWEPVEPEEPAP